MTATVYHYLYLFIIFWVKLLVLGNIERKRGGAIERERERERAREREDEERVRRDRMFNI